MARLRQAKGRLCRQHRPLNRTIQFLLALAHPRHLLLLRPGLPHFSRARLRLHLQRDRVVLFPPSNLIIVSYPRPQFRHEMGLQRQTFLSGRGPLVLSAPLQEDRTLVLAPAQLFRQVPRLTEPLPLPQGLLSSHKLNERQ